VNGSKSADVRNVGEFFGLIHEMSVCILRGCNECGDGEVVGVEKRASTKVTDFGCSAEDIDQQRERRVRRQKPGQEI
jgi:hypothetical protein